MRWLLPTVVLLTGLIGAADLVDADVDHRLLMETNEPEGFWSRVHHLWKRIIGGQEISMGQWPWLVNVRAHVPRKFIGALAVRYDDVYCGGSIINDRWILTAAHCFEVPGIPEAGLQDTKNWYVKAGSVRLKFTLAQKLCAIWNRVRQVENIHCWYYNVDKIVVHPNFSQTHNWMNDIALIRLSTALPLNTADKTVKAVQLPTQSSNWPRRDAQCAVQGWGCTTAGGSTEMIASSVNFPALDDTLCSQIAQEDIGPTRLCSGYLDMNKGICKGDSGSPLVCRDSSNEEWRQAGISSFTSVSKPGQVPGVFTRVAYFVNWISSIVNSK